jgi:MFS family permease
MNKPGEQTIFGIQRDLAVLSLSTLLWGLGEGMFIYFYPLSLQRWDMDTVQIGVVLSMLGGVMALVQVPAGYLSDRFGPRPLVRAALVLGVITALVMGVAHTMPVFILGLVGYTLTSFIGAPLNSYITAMRGGWSVQRALTFIAGSFQLGAIAGPMLGGRIGQTAGLSTVFLSSAGFFLVSTLVAFFARRPAAQEVQEKETQLASPLSTPRFLGLLVMLTLTIVALSVPQQLTSLYLQDVHHLSLQQIGLTGTFAGIGTAFVMFALGALRPALGLLAGQVLVGLFAVFMWQGNSAPVFFCGYLFVGGYRLYRSMALAYVRPLVKAADVGKTYGLLEAGNALAMILAPIGAGLLYKYDPVAVYVVSVVALVIMIMVHSLLSSGRRTTGEPFIS